MMVRIVSLALALVIALAAFAAGSFAAHAQSAKTLREQLVGTWSFVIADITTADGKKTFPFVVVRIRKDIKRPDGSVIRFDRNAPPCPGPSPNDTPKPNNPSWPCHSPLTHLPMRRADPITSP